MYHPEVSILLGNEFGSMAPRGDRVIDDSRLQHLWDNAIHPFPLSQCVQLVPCANWDRIAPCRDRVSNEIRRWHRHKVLNEKILPCVEQPRCCLCLPRVFASHPSCCWRSHCDSRLAEPLGDYLHFSFVRSLLKSTGLLVVGYPLLPPNNSSSSIVATSLTL